MAASPLLLAAAVALEAVRASSAAAAAVPPASEAAASLPPDAETGAAAPQATTPPAGAAREAAAPIPPARAASAAPPAALPLAAPPLDVGRTALAAGVGMPVHLAATVGVLAFACSGEVVEARCGRTIEGDDGALALTWALLATIPPAASGLVVWALGDDEAAPASLPWTLLAGGAGQALGFGLAEATGSEALALLSLTALPVAGEVAALVVTREAPAPAQLAQLPAATPEAPTTSPAPRAAALVPLFATQF